MGTCLWPRQGCGPWQGAAVLLLLLLAAASCDPALAFLNYLNIGHRADKKEVVKWQSSNKTFSVHNRGALISHSHRFIYIKPARTGGTSMYSCYLIPSLFPEARLDKNGCVYTDRSNTQKVGPTWSRDYWRLDKLER